MSIDKIPEEILRNIFQYCDPSSLLAIEETCTEWRSTCKKYDRDIWISHIEALWDRFTMNRPDNSSVLQRIAKLTTGKMIKMLRHIDLSRCVEKKDYQRMLFAKLVFERKMIKELGRSDPRFKGRYLSMYYPDWSLVIPEFKASYFYTRCDVERKVLHSSELCAIHWRFRFKNYADASGMSFASVFYEDGTMESEVQQQQYQWRVRAKLLYLLNESLNLRVTFSYIVCHE